MALAVPADLRVAPPRGSAAGSAGPRASPCTGHLLLRETSRIRGNRLRCRAYARRFAQGGHPAGEALWVHIAVPVEPAPASRVGTSLLVGLLAFIIGVLLDRMGLLLAGRRRRSVRASSRPAGEWPRKETVEWVNMVVGKLWRVYGDRMGRWVVGSLQPAVDDVERPRWVQAAGIRGFWIGEEPLAVRSIERRTSRMPNDLRYQIGIRYTGDARMLLSLKLNFGFFPLTIPIWIQDFDIDGELWVKLQLISREPWIGALSWAFVSLPKIKFVLLPFRRFNLMGIPVLSLYLQKLLTKDLPRLFVRPNRVVVDFVNGKSFGPVFDEYESTTNTDEKKDYVGELSITLVDGRNLSHLPFVKSDPHVILSLGDQVLCSKRNSQTTVVGPPGEPIWNQDFHMLVKNPKVEELSIQVRDRVGLAQYIVGTAEINLRSLKDTVPVDKIVPLQGSWTPWNKGLSGELLLRLTYTAYVEDEEDGILKSTEDDAEESNYYEQNRSDNSRERRKWSFVDVLAGLVAHSGFHIEEESGIPENPERSQFSLIKSSFQDLDIHLNTTAIMRGFRESPTIWIVAITSIIILVSAHVGGSS